MPLLFSHNNSYKLNSHAACSILWSGSDTRGSQEAICCQKHLQGSTCTLNGYNIYEST